MFDYVGWFRILELQCKEILYNVDEKTFNI